MAPSVGRIVHYVSRGSADGEYRPECRAAIITAADNYQPFDSDSQHIGHVGLCVLNPEGMFFNKTVVEDSVTWRGGTWHWPERVEGGAEA